MKRFGGPCVHREVDVFNFATHALHKRFVVVTTGMIGDVAYDADVAVLATASSVAESVLTETARSLQPAAFHLKHEAKEAKRIEHRAMPTWLTGGLWEAIGALNANLKDFGFAILVIAPGSAMQPGRAVPMQVE
jgi:hypothetical protein